MKFELRNLGPIKEANIELGDLTIICGKNNTGKTTITNAIYKFYRSFREHVKFKINQEDAKTTTIDLRDYIQQAIKQIEEYGDSFSKNNFSHGQFRVSVDEKDFDIITSSTSGIWTIGQHKYQVSKNGTKIVAKKILMPELETQNASVTNTASDIPTILWTHVIHAYFFRQKNNNGSIGDILLAPNERSGLISFLPFINIAFGKQAKDNTAQQTEQSNSAQAVKDLNKEKDNPSIISLPIEVYQGWELMNLFSSLVDQRPSNEKYFKHIVEYFEEIIQGHFLTTAQGEILFAPSGSDDNLPISQCSSSVKSLFLLDIYLRYIIEKGDILMIDEPELNLHPENQRKLARLLAMLINAGLKIFVTTHSDYIIREFNFLLSLTQCSTTTKKAIKKQYNYTNIEFLDSTRVRAFEIKNGNSLSLEVNPTEGIGISDMDDTIMMMMQIQRSIVREEMNNA